MIKKTTSEFISQAELLFPNKFVYSSTSYVNNKTKITIICKVHGQFSIYPTNFLKGVGCTECSKSIKKLKTSEFIEKAISVHGNKYDYSKAQYLNMKTSLTIQCKLHGEFGQVAKYHLDGNGCTKCGYEKVALLKADTQENFLLKAIDKHSTKYDYSKVLYTSSKDSIVIGCPTHGDFNQIAVTHTQGSGCPKCVQSKFNRPKDYKGKPTILYYINIAGYYKIGITTTSIEDRYRKDIKLGMKYTELKKWKFSNGEIAALIEKKCLEETIKYQLLSHKERTIIPTTKGSSELRARCILQTIEKNLKGDYEEI